MSQGVCRALDVFILVCGILAAGGFPAAEIAQASAAYDISYALETLPDGSGVLSVSFFSSSEEDLRVVLPSSIDEVPVTGVGDYAFWLGMDAISEIIIPEGVTSIGDYAFAECRGLTCISLPKSLKTIGTGAFSGCESLEEITLPENLEYLGEDAFAGTRLREITVSEKNQAFVSKDGILFSGDEKTLLCYPSKRPGFSYVIPEKTTALSANAFAGSLALKRITLSASLSRVETGALSAPALREIIVPQQNRFFQVKNDLLMDQDGRMVYAYPAGNEKVSVSVPDGVTNIAARAFYGAAALSHVALPDTLSVIGKEAFAGSGLRRLYLPAEVTEMSGGALKDCISLQAVYLPAGGMLRRISEECFLGDESLLTITVPEGVSYLCYGAFQGCDALTDVTLPNTCEYVDEDAFDPGTQALFHVTEGSAALSWCMRGRHAYISSPRPKENQIYTDRDTIRKVQAALNKAGFSAGKEDGLLGTNTKKAILAYRSEHHLESSDVIDDVLLEHLGIETG